MFTYRNFPFIQTIEGDGQGGGGSSTEGTKPNEGAPVTTTDEGDKGFPANTHFKDMTPEQQVAYKSHQLTKSENLLAKFEGVTPEQLAQFKADADAYKQLVESQKPEDQKASEKVLNDAIEKAREEERSKYAPVLVSAAFKAEAAGRLEADKLDALTKHLNVAAFIGADGAVDSEAVKTLIDSIAPAKTVTQSSTTVHQGFRRSEGGSSLSRGSELWKQLNNKK